MPKFGLAVLPGSSSSSFFITLEPVFRRRQRLKSLLLVFACILLGAASQAQSQSRVTPGPGQSAQRILVKLQPQLAREVEAQLPAQGPITAMTIRPGQAVSANIKSFLARYSAGKITPLYPEIIRARQQHGWSDAQFADQVRQRFPKRPGRQPNPPAVPEISRTYAMEFPGASAQQISGLVQRLQADSDVEFAEPDKFVTTSQATLPNDPFLSSSGTWGQTYQDLWGHYKIGAPTAWNTALGDGIIVAVVDTGIDYNHPDIAANVWINTSEIASNGIDDDGNGFIDDVRGWDFIGSNCFSPTPGNDPIDHFGHGTHVAGTIAAVGNNGIGIIGVAWHSRVMAIKGLDDGGCGLESTLAPAIQYAANNGADVINASWGGQGTSQTIEQAIQFAYGLGVVFVAAAGNSSEDAENFFPANSPEAITVAASDPFDQFAFFSNFGSKIDVTAPGVDILSLHASGSFIGPLVGTDYMRLNGTSMATPHVVGTAALILSQHPAYTPEDVRQVLRVSASEGGSPGWDPQFGYGIVNANAALALPAVLEAHIIAPPGGAHINSTVPISGIAQGPTFDHYVLEYGAGLTPATWTQFNTASNPVANGTLGTFDPTTIPDGVYTVRLSVFDGANHAFTDRLEVVVDYVTITSPVPPAVPVTAEEFKPGAQIAITGTATGASFSDYRFEWAEGIAPSTGWSSTGMSLSNGGTVPVSNAVLGTWDTSGISKADYYTIRVQVDDAGFVSEADTLVYLEPSLLSQNWPQPLAAGPDIGSGFLPVRDALGNQRLGLVTPTYLFFSQPSQYISFSPDGSSVNAINMGPAAYRNPAVANIDGVAGDEFVAPEAFQIDIFHTDSTSFTLQKPSGFDLYNLRLSQALLEDVEGNSQLDVVDLGEAGFNTAPTAALFAWRPDGSMLNSSFPVTIPDPNPDLTFGWGPRVFVGDVQGNGSKQFVVQEGVSATQVTLGLFAHDGTPVPWAVPVLDGQIDSMILADLDHNGTLETLLLVDSGSQSMLHVFQPDGTERAGWPLPLAQFGGGNSFMAVGDLDRDGTEEIVVAQTNGGLYVFEPDGSSFLNVVSTSPVRWVFDQPVVGPVALADIDGDGYPEILLTKWDLVSAPNPLLPNVATASARAGTATVQVNRSLQSGLLESTAAVSQSSSLPGPIYIAPTLIAVRRDGTVTRSWTLLGARGNQPFLHPTITVGDFNQDGTTDIAVNYLTIEGGGAGGFLNQGVALVLSTGAAFHPEANDWPMVYQNARNSAVQRRSVTLSLTSPVARTLISGTTAVAAQTAGPVASMQFKLDGGNLGAPVNAPPFTLQWDTTSAADGAHTLVAVATDGTGRPVASAPITVFVRLPDFSQSVSPSSATIKAGGSATFTLTITPLSTAQQTVSFSCSGLPAASQCTFSPASVAPNGAPISTTVTIKTTAASAGLAAPPLPKSGLPLYASISSGIVGMAWIALAGRRRRIRKAQLFFCIATLAMAAVLTSCGGGSSTPGNGSPGTPAGTSQVTITAASGSISHTTAVTLTVTN